MQKKFIVAGGLAMLLFAGLALATIYFPNPPFSLSVSTVGNPAKVYTANIVAYGDVDVNASGVQCFESDYNIAVNDPGPNPLFGGIISWRDGGVFNSYTDSCDGNSVVEGFCGVNTLVDGNTISSATMAVGKIDCTTIPGKTTCATVFGAARCV